VDRPVTGPGEDITASPHRIVNPDALERPSGYAHAVVPVQGRTIYVAGQTAHGTDGSLPGEGIVEQFDAAAAHVVIALEAAGARPEHLVSLQIFVTDLDGYLADSKAIGRAYRAHFGRHFGATALVEVSRLAGEAKVELICVAVVPE